MAAVGLVRTLAQLRQMGLPELMEPGMEAVEIQIPIRAEAVMAELRAAVVVVDVIQTVTEEMVRGEKSASGCGEHD